MKQLKRTVAVLIVLVMIVSIVGMTAHAVEPRTTFICPACGGGAYGVVDEDGKVPCPSKTVASCSEASWSHKHTPYLVTTDYYCGDCGTYVRSTTSYGRKEYCSVVGSDIYP